MSHKFNIGQTVVFTPGAAEILDKPAKATVTRLLPKEGVSYQYHVQVELDGPGRLARESQLRAM